jgi:hypothetical protein
MFTSKKTSDSKCRQGCEKEGEVTFDNAMVRAQIKLFIKKKSE